MPPDSPAGGHRVLETGICVIGAGPAGATVARRLALLGHRVCLVERSAFPRQRIGESLPPSILPVLETLGLRETVEAAGFLRPEAAIVHWAGTCGRRAYGEGVSGFQVDRGRFDALLLAAARDAGVEILQPVQARRPVAGPQGWTVPLRGCPDFDAVRAGYLVDAAGKHAGLSRRATRYSQPTAALYAYWQHPEGVGPETRVEAGEDAWYWGAPLPGGAFNAAVFVDLATCAGLTAARRTERYLALLARSALLRPCLPGRLLGPVSCCDASAYHDADPIGMASLRVGEAGFSIDPLSSQGVQSAMASALQASIAAHTILTRPDNAPAAIEFYRDRQRESVTLHARLAAGHCERQYALSRNDFWQARSRPSVPPEAPRPPLVATTLSASQPVELAPVARLVETPVVTGDLVATAAALAHPGLERPVAYLDGQPLAPLIRQIGPDDRADRIVERWSAHAGPDRALRILQWLWRHGIVVASARQ